jgi:uncharacterized protein (DUF433 family)
MTMSIDTERRRLPAQIVSDPSICGGAPTVRGTRIPAAMIMLYLQAGRSREEIFTDYPRLPLDGIEAVSAWAEATFGTDWRKEKVAA